MLMWQEEDLWWLILCASFNGQRETQEAEKAHFLGMYVRVLLEDISNIINEQAKQMTISNVGKHHPIH